jgi:hypothetical protein
LERLFHAREAQIQVALTPEHARKRFGQRVHAFLVGAGHPSSHCTHGGREAQCATIKTKLFTFTTTEQSRRIQIRRGVAKDGGRRF